MYVFNIFGQENEPPSLFFYNSENFLNSEFCYHCTELFRIISAVDQKCDTNFILECDSFLKMWNYKI